MLVGFSVDAKAAAPEKDYYIYTIVNSPSNSGTVSLGSRIHYPLNGTRENGSHTATLTTPSNAYRITAEMYVCNTDKSILWEKDSIVRGKLENVYFYGSVQYPNVATYSMQLQSCYAYLLYADGSTEYIDCTIQKVKTNYYLINFDFTASKDVSQICFQCVTDGLPSIALNKSVNVTVRYGEPTTSEESNEDIIFGNFSSEEQSEESGWLAKIWAKLTGGFSDMIAELKAGFSNLVSSLSDLLNSIVELPSKIWSFIENGLKSLFVPNEEYMISYKSKWETLLSEKLGAVWQVVDVTFGAWEEIDVSDITNTVKFPLVTIPLPDDNEFSFGGYDVQVVPTGFDFLATAVKTISAIVCTFAFINGIRKRYDEIMGVEQ